MVTGSTGAVTGGSLVVVVTLDTGHYVVTTAAGDGSFSVSTFAPPGTSLLVKADPDGARVRSLLDTPGTNAKGGNQISAVPGTIVRVPVSGPTGLAFASGGLTQHPDAAGGSPIPWMCDGVINTREFAAGGTLQVNATVRLVSGALAQAGAMRVNLRLAFERLTGHDGTPTAAQNIYSSVFLTATGLPIERQEDYPGWGTHQTVELQKTAADRAEVSVSPSFVVPPDFLPGYYRPFLLFDFQGTPNDAGVSRTFVLPDNAHRDRINLAQSAHGVTYLPVVKVRSPAAPRLSWTLLTDTLSNGTRGTRAIEDRNRFGIAPRIVTQSETFVIPRDDAATGARARYRLEPFLPAIAIADRHPPNRPAIPFRFPSGSLTVRIQRPDGSAETIGPAPFAQSRMRGVVGRDGGELSSGGGSITEPYELSTLDARFEVTFEQYGRHVIMLDGAIEDIWGNTWLGGGTYEVFVARILALDTAVVPGTAFSMGDVLSSGVVVTPAVGADVNVRVRLAPNSDATRTTDRTVRGRANRFGYFHARGGVTLDQPGEYRVDVTASYIDAQGTLWMGARTWGGVVAPANPTIVAHGRRGIDTQPAGAPQWFFRTQTGQPMGSNHVHFPFHSGDVMWLEKADAVVPTITFQDPSGSVASVLRNLGTLNEQRAAAGEIDLRSERPDGVDEHIDPSRVAVWGYAYRSVQRPLVRVREEIAENVPSLYWRFGDTYALQIGTGVSGDLANDVKFQYGGAVLRGPAFATPHYGIYGSLFVLVPDNDARGGTRVFPPFQGNAGGPSGGPLFTLKGRDIDAFAHLTAVRPGTVLEVGDVFALAGALAPTLPGLVNARIETPSGQVRSSLVRANKVGYFYNPAHDFIVTEPGIYTVDVSVTFDGQTSAGQLTAPLPTGDVLGTSGGRFFVYAVARGSAALDVALPSQQTLTGNASFKVTANAPAGITLTRAHGTGMMPGFVLTSGDLARTATALTYAHDPAALAVDFPNLDINPPADVITATLFASGTDAAGNPTHAAKILALHGAELFNVPHAAASTANDTDNDGLPNDWETKFGFNPSSTSNDDADGDPDGDGATNLGEYQLDTHPLLPNTWNLPEGATGFFTERIAVANPTAEDAAFSVTFLKEGGTPTVQSYTLPAQRRLTITVNDLPGLSNAAVSAVSTTTKSGVVVERTMLWDARDGSDYGGHTGKAIANAGTIWYLAEGEASFFDTYILLANATASPATVTLSFLLESGDTITQSRGVPANARVTVYANDVPGLRGNAFSTTITSDVPITVERAMYFGNNVRTFNGGHEAAAVAAPATSWFVAEGRTGPFFDTYLLLANPGPVPAVATLTFLTPGGGTVTQTRTLGPTSRTTIHVDSVAGLTDTDVSASIVSTEPIIVERAMYWPDPFSAWYEAHGSAGVTQTGTQWALAEGEIGGTLGFETYLLLANPGASPATVTLTFLRASGNPLTLTRTVPANGRLTVSAGEAPLSAGEQFGVAIDASHPIAVERAMYWNGGGQFWGAGTNETAVRIR